MYIYTHTCTLLQLLSHTGFEPGFPASLTSPITTTLILPVEIFAGKDYPE
jgi:hypothetical protein